MTTQAFLVDIETGETVQRMVAADDTLDAFVPRAGQIVVRLGEGAPDIEEAETYLDGTLKLRAREPDTELEFAVAKVKAREAVKAQRQRAETGGCETGLGLIDTDTDSQIKLNGAATMAIIAKVAGRAFLIDWTLADNSTVTLDADAMIALASAAGGHVSACHEHARGLKAAIERAADQKELAQIDIEAGWPNSPPPAAI